MKTRVLYVCHNHPAVRPGGAEAYALELYSAMKTSDEFEPYFLAKGGPPMSTNLHRYPGSPFGTVNDDPHQHFIYTDIGKYDRIMGVSTDRDLVTRQFHDFLTAIRPDIVHFQHTLFLGYDLIRETRNTLPSAPIFYTLHEYLPMCHRNGQLVRLMNDELCTTPSPHRCNECFPDISPETFFLRKRFIQSHLDHVDRFIAPSRFLLERYVDWGLPRQKIRYEEYGRLPVTPVPEIVRLGSRNRLGYFGQFTPNKGVNVLLKAMRLLLGSGDDVTLRLHGANIEMQPKPFQNEFVELVAATSPTVSLIGRYDHRELPRLMGEVDWVVVPSIWWENSPLVIQEAFQHGRPVICSDIGGMAEKVADGVSGLHFRIGDPSSLADVIRRAVRTRDLWKKLRSGIPRVLPMADHVSNLSQMYVEQLGARRPGQRGVVGATNG
jgi:glycosyltransferase involved in cell wall biosynthesis